MGLASSGRCTTVRNFSATWIRPVRSNPVVFGATVKKSAPSPVANVGYAGDVTVIQLTSDRALHSHDNGGSTSVQITTSG